MIKARPYQAILISSIILVIVFVCTLIFSVQTSHKHSKHVEEMNSIFLAQSSLGSLGAVFDQYVIELEKDLIDKKFENRDKWTNTHTQMDQMISQMLSSVTDPSVEIYLNDIKTLSERLKRFEEAISSPDNLGLSELFIYQKKFQELRSRIAQHFLERYNYNKDANSNILNQGRIASVFIVVFGAAVALALAVSVFMSLKQTVSRNYVQMIMQYVGIAVVVSDENGKVTFVNDKMKELFGVNSKSLEEVMIKDLVEQKLFEEFIKTNKSFEQETQIKSTSLGWIPVLASGTVLKDETNSYQGYIITAQDLRSSKAMQKQLMHAEKMVSLGTIAAGVAHEINNPISFIQSNLSTLKDYFASIKDILNSYEQILKNDQQVELKIAKGKIDELNKKIEAKDLAFLLGDVNQALDDSLDGTERIKEIVQGLRSFSRNDESVLGFVDVNEVLEGTLKLVWNELKYKCEVIKEFSTMPSLRCYPRQLSQVFMNLLLNAGQAISEHGKIVIKSETTDKTICVTISDTGKGMTKEVLEKIFDPFFTTKAVGAGTGLGLSISYGIIKKHGGSIEVESEEGKGTTFKVYLPFEGVKNV